MITRNEVAVRDKYPLFAQGRLSYLIVFSMRKLSGQV